MKSRIHEVNPYSSLTDGHSAIDEYFKLKRMLYLTDEERYNFKYCQPYEELDKEDVIARLFDYIDKADVSMQTIANWLGVTDTALYLYRSGRRKPNEDTTVKIANFLKSKEDK